MRFEAMACLNHCDTTTPERDTSHENTERARYIFPQQSQVYVGPGLRAYRDLSLGLKPLIEFGLRPCGARKADLTRLQVGFGNVERIVAKGDCEERAEWGHDSYRWRCERGPAAREADYPFITQGAATGGPVCGRGDEYGRGWGRFDSGGRAYVVCGAL